MLGQRVWLVSILIGIALRKTAPIGELPGHPEVRTQAFTATARVLKSHGQKKYKPTLKNKETKTAPIYIPTTVNRIACCPSLCPTPHVSKGFIFANRRDEQLYPKVVLFFICLTMAKVIIFPRVYIPL